MFSHENRSFLTAGRTQVKSFTAEWPEIIMTAFRVCAADSGYTIQVIAAGL
jgi:hypothetical protein